MAVPSIEYDPLGNAYVTDENGNLTVYAPDGSIISQSNPPPQPVPTPPNYETPQTIPVTDYGDDLSKYAGSINPPDSTSQTPITPKSLEDTGQKIGAEVPDTVIAPDGSIVVLPENPEEWSPDFTSPYPWLGMPSNYEGIKTFQPSLSSPLPPWTGEVASKDKVFDEKGEPIDIKTYNANLPELKARAQLSIENILKVDNVKLGDDTWVKKEWYDALSPEIRQVGAQKGYIAMLDAIQAEYAKDKIQLADGKWMLIESKKDTSGNVEAIGFNDLKDKYKSIGIREGYDAMLKAIEDDTQRQVDALSKLDANYKSPMGDGYYIKKYIEDNPNEKGLQTLKDAGFNDEVIKEAENYIKNVNETVSLLDKYTPVEMTKQGSLKNIDSEGLRRAMVNAGIDDIGSSAVVKWRTLSDEDKQKVAGYYGTDPYNKNRFASMIASMNMISSDNIAVGMLIVPVTAIGTPIAKASIGQKVEPIEIANASITAALMAVPFIGNVAGRIVQGGAGIYFTAQTVKNWAGMGNAERGLSVAMDTMLLLAGLPIAGKVVSKVGEYGKRIIVDERGNTITIPDLSKPVIDNVKANYINLTAREEARLQAILQKIIVAVQDGNASELAKLSDDLADLSKTLGDRATGETFRQYALAMKANPDAFINIAKDIGVKPSDVKGNVKLITDINDVAKIERVKPVRTLEEITGDPRMAKLSGEIKNVTDYKKLPYDPNYELGLKTGKLPSVDKPVYRTLSESEYNELILQHQQKYESEILSGKVKEKQYYDSKTGTYVERYPDYYEWARDNPTPSKEIFIRNDKVPLSQTEYEFYKIAKKEIKSLKDIDIETLTYKEKELLKTASGQEELLERLRIKYAQSEPKHIESAVRMQGLDWAVDNFGKNKVSIVYPKLSEGTIIAARQLTKLRNESVMPFRERTFHKVQTAIYQKSLGVSPSEDAFERLLAKSETPIISDETLVAWQKAVGAPTKTAKNIARTMPDIQVTEGGGFKFVPKILNEAITKPVYTQDVNLLAQVMYQMRENRIDIPMITNEFPEKEMAQYLKSSEEDLWLSGTTVEEESERLVAEIKESVKNQGMIATILKYGKGKVSAVYPYYFEY
ncbi:MAG: hypothetical protein PHQ86_08240, partial [Dehalococcoidales bacterium]|nr:hypothetical protein [Dehalococcoidales bacterium]